jgi:hypothetical protein
LKGRGESREQFPVLGGLPMAFLKGEGREITDYLEPPDYFQFPNWKNPSFSTLYHPFGFFQLLTEKYFLFFL